MMGMTRPVAIAMVSPTAYFARVARFLAATSAFAPINLRSTRSVGIARVSPTRAKFLPTSAHFGVVEVAVLAFVGLNDR